MVRRKSDSIVSAYLEHVSGALLERYPKVIRKLIQGRSGIYALYKGDKIYYIGLAINLRSRVKMHLKDRHTRKWDRFSVYLTTMSAHIKPLESLMLRVAMPSGNRVKGGLPRAANIYPTIVKMIRYEDADALARLMGGNVARRRRRAKTRRARGTIPLAGLVERRMALRAVIRERPTGRRSERTDKSGTEAAYTNLRRQRQKRFSAVPGTAGISGTFAKVAVGGFDFANSNIDASGLVAICPRRAVAACQFRG